MIKKNKILKLVMHRWDLALLVLSNTWLIAPYLNRKVSRVTTLISEYEAVGQPYSAYFRFADLLAASVVLVGGIIILKRGSLPRLLASTIVVIGIGMALDGLTPMTCRGLSTVCLQGSSPLVIVHKVESTLTAMALLFGSYLLYVHKPTKGSLGFIVMQIAYGVQLTVLKFVFHSRPSTVAQFAYQFLVTIGLVMMLGAGLQPKRSKLSRSTRNAVSLSSSVLGILLVTLVTLQSKLWHTSTIAPHLHGHAAWLTLYGIVIGLGLVFFSLKLLYGEVRSRIIGLILLGMCVLYTAVIRPQLLTLGLSFTLFVVLYISRENYLRPKITVEIDDLRRSGSP